MTKINLLKSDHCCLKNTATNKRIYSPQPPSLQLVPLPLPAPGSAPEDLGLLAKY